MCSVHRSLSANSAVGASRLKRRWSIDPQQPRLRTPGIAPAVRRRTFKVQAVAGLQMIVLTVAEPDFKRAAQHVQEFLAFVRVRFAAAPAGFHAKKMRLHGGVAQASSSMRTPAFVSRIFRCAGRTSRGVSPAVSNRERIL